MRPNDRRGAEGRGTPPVRRRPRPPTGGTAGLPREVAREIDQIAHHGKAKQVKEAVAQASALFEEGSYAEALAPLLRAKTDAPRSGAVREMLGLVYYRLGRWREAARELAAYRRLSGRRDQDHLYADAERALGKPERAVDILDDLPAEVDEEAAVEALVVLGGALTDLGRPGEAVERLQRGPIQPPEVMPHHLRLWYALADALERDGRRPEARSWWDAIYAEDPDFFDVESRRLGLRSSG